MVDGNWYTVVGHKAVNVEGDKKGRNPSLPTLQQNQRKLPDPKRSIASKAILKHA